MGEIQAACRIELVTDVPDEELDRQTRLVRRDLAELGVGRVEHVTGGAIPDGARAVDAVEVGQLIAMVPPTAAALRALIDNLGSWFTAGKDRRVVVEIDGDRLELGSASVTEQSSVVRAWIDRQQVT